MGISKHGLSIGIGRVESEFFLTFKMVGQLTHEDYKIIAPMLDSALEGIKEPEIKVLIDGTEMEGWELRAAWDDFKLGLKHGNQFTKIAIVGNKKWQKFTSKIGGWFIAGDVNYFEDENEALAWLSD